MTNEQLAALIGEGGNDELLPLLWEKMRKFYGMLADRYVRGHADKCAQCGVTAADIKQESYFAMLESIKAYNGRKPEQQDLLFTSFCDYHFKNHADNMIGNNRGNRTDPLRNSTLSLDEPLTNKDGDEDATRGDLLPDPESEDPFKEIEEKDFRQSLWKTAKAALKSRPILWEVTERYYRGGETLQEIGDSHHITRERVRQIKETALRRLRHSASMKTYCTTSYYQPLSIESFRRGGSIVERITEQRDRHDRYSTFVSELERRKLENNDE